jgi:hypothetical protein
MLLLLLLLLNMGEISELFIQPCMSYWIGIAVLVRLLLAYCSCFCHAERKRDFPLGAFHSLLNNY